MTTVCKNCNKSFDGRFCNYCGQTVDTHEINTHFLYHDIQHGLFHFEKGILYTLKQLFIRPGYSIKEFIEGKRVLHSKPISFVLILAGIYGFLFHYITIDSSLQFFMSDDTGTIIDFKKIFEWFSAHYAFKMLLLIPISSLGTYLAFRKEKYNFLEHIIINSFLAGLRIVIRLFFLPLILIVEKENRFIFLGISDFIGLYFVFWAFIQLFDTLSVKQKILKTFLSYIYLGLVYICLIFVIVLIIICLRKTSII